MKRLSRIAKGATVSVLAAMVSVAAKAQGSGGQYFRGFGQMMGDANEVIHQNSGYIFDFASLFIGVIGAIMLIWNYLKRTKADQQSNDSLVSWGTGLVFAALGLEVIKFVFFS